MSRKLQKDPTLLSFVNTDIVLRAFIVAVVLGSVLTLANQPGAVFGSDTLRLLPLTLVYLTPFVVVMVSQLLGVRRATLDRRPGHVISDSDNSFLATAISHGIPLRTLIVAAVIGTANTLIVGVSALTSDGSVSDLPVPLIAQAFALPMAFGLLSQTISYRRTVTAFGRQLSTASHPLST